MATNLIAILAVTCGLMLWLPSVIRASKSLSLQAPCSEPAPVSGAYRTRWNSTNALYVCLDGHSPVDEFSITCNGSQWPPTNRCRVDCGPPAQVDGATLFVNDTEEGAVAEYRCYDNYTDTTKAPPTRTCSPLTGRWTDVGAVCTGLEDLALNKSSSSPNVTDGNAETCTDSTSVLITISTNDFYNFHSVVLYYSNHIGEVNVTLHMDYPDAKPGVCGSLTYDEPGEHVIDCATFMYRARSMHISTNARGGGSGLCDVQAHGRMAFVDCMRPPVVVGATATYTNTSWMAKAVYTCVPPYVYIGGGNTISCLVLGWSPPDIKCAEMEDFVLRKEETDLFTDNDGNTSISVRSSVNILLDRVVEVHVVVLWASKSQKWDDIDVRVTETGDYVKECKQQDAGTSFDNYTVRAFDCPGFPFAKQIEMKSDKTLLSVCEVKVYGRDASTGALECQQTEEGLDYKGSVNFTQFGNPCLNWEDVHTDIKDFPDYKMADIGNKCRTPKPGGNGPFCYVTPDVYEYCPVPMCDAVCRQGDGRTYHGYMDETRSGSSCIPWDSNLEQFASDGIMSDRSEAVCRNPIGSMSQPWCLTEPASEYELCDVPLCPVTTVTVAKTGTVGVDERQMECFCWIGDDTESTRHTPLASAIRGCSLKGGSVLLCYTGEGEQKDWVYYILDVSETTTHPQSLVAEATLGSHSSTFVADSTTHTTEQTSPRRDSNTTATHITTARPDNNNRTSSVNVTRPDDQQAETTSPTPDNNTNMAETTSETLTQQQQTTSQRPQTLKSTTSVSQTSTASPTKQNCQCRCKKDLSTSAIAAVMNERKANLTVNPRTTSASIRKKTSAEDKRPTATVSGTSCVAVIAVMFSVLFIPDIINLLTFIFKLKK